MRIILILSSFGNFTYSVESKMATKQEILSSSQKTAKLDMAIRFLCNNTEADNKIVLNKLISIASTEKNNGVLAARMLLIYLYSQGVGTKDEKEFDRWTKCLSSNMKQKTDQENVKSFKFDFNWINHALNQISSQILIKNKSEKNKCTNDVLGAMYDIVGYMYLRGWGTEKNQDKAFEFLKKASDLGNIFAHCDLGKIYQERGDINNAVRLYRAAAEQGNKIAINRLKPWNIGALIHIEDKSNDDYIGGIDINNETREAIKKVLGNIKDLCSDNTKVELIHDINDQNIIILKDRQQARDIRLNTGKGEGLHATLIYTRRGIERGSFEEIYENLQTIDPSLPKTKPPTLEQVSNVYQKVIKPESKFEINDIIQFDNKAIVASLIFNGKKEILNQKGGFISPSMLHVTLLNSTFKLNSEQIDDMVEKLKKSLVGKKVKVGDIKGISDIEFGISKSNERLRPIK